MAVSSSAKTMPKDQKPKRTNSSAAETSLSSPKTKRTVKAKVEPVPPKVKSKRPKAADGAVAIVEEEPAQPVKAAKLKTKRIKPAEDSVSVVADEPVQTTEATLKRSKPVVYTEPMGEDQLMLKKAKKSKSKVAQSAELPAPVVDDEPVVPTKATKPPKSKSKRTDVPKESTPTIEDASVQPPTVAKLSPKKSVAEPSLPKSILKKTNVPVSQPKPPAKETSKKGKKAKALTPEPPSSEDNDDAEAGEENEILLHGFSSESDSSDEDDGVDDNLIDVGKLPTVAKDDASVKRKLDKAKRQKTQDRGVIYLGRIPHGFYEDEMKAYFTQFGDVTRLRLSRNKKTGRSKHYAFIEFESSAVADIVAETMDNYLLMGHILRCKIIPKDEVHPELWVGANRKFRRVPTDRIARLQQNKERTEEEQQKVEQRLLKRQALKKRKLEAAGIGYDIEPVAYTKKAKPSAA